MAEAKDAKDAKESKGGSKKLIIIVAVAVLLTAVLAGAGTWFLLGQKQAVAAKAEGHEAAEEEEKHEEGAVPIFQQLEPLVVNLSGDSESVMRVVIAVQLDSEEHKEKLTQFMPKITGDLILLYSGKTREELLTQEGKLKLIAETKAAINTILGSKKPKDDIVKNVSLTEMIIQ